MSLGVFTDLCISLWFDWTYSCRKNREANRYMSRRQELSPELRRHLPPSSTGRQAPPAIANVSTGGREWSKRLGVNGSVATLIGCGIFTLMCASFPYFVTKHIRPLNNREEVRIALVKPFLSSSIDEIRNGLYMR